MAKIETVRDGEAGVPSTDFLKRLSGWSLITAEILYRMPDHPGLLQSFIWQEYDVAPHYPALRRFLDFWRESLDGPLHSVRVAHDRLVRPAEIRLLGSELRLH
ncbi:MAG: usg protein [Hyphomicrobiales bacterium]|nr:usg protein [Hyphomicrobiales bacterium]